METNNNKLNKEKYLLNENQEAWVHYRHMENMRNQYLGFYFTILTGVSIYLSGYKLTLDSIIGVSILIFVFYFLTLITYYSIVKIKYVLSGYESIMIKMRAQFLLGDDALQKELDVRHNMNSLAKHKYYSIQSLAELLLLFFITLTPILYFFFVKHVSEHMESDWENYLKCFRWLPIILTLITWIISIQPWIKRTQLWIKRIKP
jgi:hypothetical protein